MLTDLAAEPNSRAKWFAMADGADTEQTPHTVIVWMIKSQCNLSLDPTAELFLKSLLETRLKMVRFSAARRVNSTLSSPREGLIL